MKRFTHLPQVGLGVAFTWGVPWLLQPKPAMIDDVSVVFIFDGHDLAGHL